MGILITLIVLCVVVTFHELGHFAAARINKVKVDEFAVGMGPVIFKKQGKETLYTIRLIPIGGFCKMAGEDETVDNEGSFSGKSVWRRIVICSSGILVNMFLAFICVFIYLAAHYYITPIVLEVAIDSPAQNAGFEIGDKIVSVDGVKIKTADGLIFMVQNSTSSLNFQVERGGKFRDIVVYPTFNSESDTSEIGLTQTPAYSSIFKSNQLLQDFSTLTLDSIQATWRLHLEVLNGLKGIFTREVPVEELSGVVGVTAIVTDQSKEIMENETIENRGSALWWFILQLTALLSINLAIINLLPIPALDGGRILLLIVEGVRRKPLRREVAQSIIAFSFMLLMVFVVLITFKDIFGLV